MPADESFSNLLNANPPPAADYRKPEFGSPADPREFKALHAYSPYHNVRPEQTVDSRTDLLSFLSRALKMPVGNRGGS